MLIFEGVVHPDPLTSFTLIRKVRITYVLLYAIYVRLICQGNPGPPKTATYKGTMYHHLPGDSDPMSWCTLVAGMLDHRWVEVARDKHKQTKMPSLRIIGPSYGGVWICIAGFLRISKPLVLRSMILRVVEMFNKQKHRVFFVLKTCLTLQTKTHKLLWITRKYLEDLFVCLKKGVPPIQSYVLGMGFFDHQS